MLVRALLIALIAYLILLPLGDVLAYPDRISVLPNLQTDAEAYYQLGRELAETGSFRGLPPRHPPGWIATLAFVFRIAGASYIPGKLVSWLALIVSVVACAWLAQRLHGDRGSWIAALLCASSAGLRGYVGTIQYEVFTGALLLGVVVLAVRAVEAVATPLLYRRAVWTGLLGATLILTRETFAVVLPLVAVWMAHRVSARSGRRTAISVAALVTAVAMAPAVGWTIVQSVRFGSLITISEKGPIVIELGHNPLANGTYNAPLVGIGQPTGLAYAIQHPAREVVLSARKVLYFWGVLRDGWNVPRPGAVWLWRASTGLVPVDLLGAIARGGWLLALFVIALWQLGRHGLSTWWVVPAIVLLIMLVHVATLSSHRFAVPTLPLVFVLVSGPIARVVDRLLPAVGSPTVWIASMLLVAIIVAMQFQSWPLRMHLHAADLDGLSADNVVDEVAGRHVRVADARRGVRPVALLTDEYIARGLIRLQTHARRTSNAPSESVPAMRITMVDLDGTTICGSDVAAGALKPDRFDAITMTCHVPRDTVATLAIFSLGIVDVAIDQVTLDWMVR